MKKFVFALILFGIFCSAYSADPKTVTLAENNRDSAIHAANDTLAYLYLRPKPFTFVKNSLYNIYETPQQLFKKENLRGLAVVAVSSAILFYYDQELVDAAQQFGRYINLSQDNNTYNLSPWKEAPLYVPTDMSSGLYYIGDGIAELGVNLGFYIYGNVMGDARALRTASELTEGIVSVGVYIQLLKHLTGHETPMRASVSGGRWRPFTSPAEYSKSVPKFDAFPSGHLATAMVTTTVISMNYPEYKFIKPLCYSLMALCGYQMMNNGVHWAGDYPLAIAMGYTIGKLAVQRGRTQVKNPAGVPEALLIKPRAIFDVKPTLFGYDAAGLSLSVTF